MKIGIDKISFHVPNYYIDMTDLALARDVDPNKFHIGLGQDQMAVIPYTQDIVSLAANAAQRILTPEDKQKIDMVILGTETSPDFSKAGAVTIHRLLDIQPFARAYEIKEACYGATAALMQAREYVKNHPERKVLVLASDISKYGLNSGGEPTQGAGAVAMLISQDPNIMELSDESIFYTQDVYDFWRPAHHEFPLVDGHLSNEIYINAFVTVWQRLKANSNLSEKDFAAICFHLPYTKMGRKALQAILPEMAPADQERLQENYEPTIRYSRRVGNLYTGSLYLGLLSLLENGNLQAGSQIGLFSYGSGAVSEFFIGQLVEGYQEHLLTAEHQSLLAKRNKLTIPEYEEMFQQSLPTDGSQVIFNDPSAFAIKEIKDDIRYYNGFAN